MYVYIYDTYKYIRGSIVKPGAGRREANPGGEIRDIVHRVQVRRHDWPQSHRLRYEVRRYTPVGESPRRPSAVEVAAVGPEVALQHRRDLVVVARIHRGVSEHDHRRDVRGGAAAAGDDEEKKIG